MTASSKSNLRKQIAALRNKLTPQEREQAARAVVDRVMPLVGDAQTVLVYSALAHELSLAGVVDKLQQRGVEVVYPRVDGPRELALCAACNCDALVAGSFGVEEPGAHVATVEPKLIDVALVPGVAFTKEGERLGYGGGYYDTLLPKLRKDAMTIGLGFDFQLVESLPTEEHDFVLDTVVTV